MMLNQTGHYSRAGISSHRWNGNLNVPSCLLQQDVCCVTKVMSSNKSHFSDSNRFQHLPCCNFLLYLLQKQVAWTSYVVISFKGSLCSLHRYIQTQVLLLICKLQRNEDVRPSCATYKSNSSAVCSQKHNVKLLQFSSYCYKLGNTVNLHHS